MVVTVFGDERHVLESIEAGATGYLLKDSLPNDFVEQIRLLRAGGSPISPIIARQLLARFQAAGALPAPVRSGTTGAAREPAPPVEADVAVGDGPGLSEREQSVLALVTKGFTYDEIAGLLGVSRHTVMTYVKRIYRKLQVNSKTEAVYEARKLGLVRD
jgi:DNA-binding NarL/FixJ family response regulator